MKGLIILADREFTLTTNSSDETIEVASRLAMRLGKGDLIAMTGEIGAGKTVFAKGIAKGLGIVDYKDLSSPTFVILKGYKGNIDLYHFDVYRLDVAEFEDTIDYREYFYGSGVSVVEWSDRITEILPEDRIDIEIEHMFPTSRKLKFSLKGRFMEKIDEISEAIKKIS